MSNITSNIRETRNTMLGTLAVKQQRAVGVLENMKDVNIIQGPGGHSGLQEVSFVCAGNESSLTTTQAQPHKPPTTCIAYQRMTMSAWHCALSEVATTAPASVGAHSTRPPGRRLERGSCW